MLKLHIHSFGFRFHYRHKPGFGIHAFIEEAAAMGFSGVNVSAFPPDFPYLNGVEPRHLAEVRRRLERHGLAIDIETSGTAPEHLGRLLEIGQALGAQHLRTYTKPAPGGARQQVADAIAGLRAMGPVAERLGIGLLLENHEDLVATETAEILAAVDHPNVGCLFDYGNSMVFFEDPLVSLERLRPWLRSGHMKDHVALRPGVAGKDEPLWLGVPLGDGNLPIVETTRALIAAGADRVCFENCWAYETRFRDRRGAGVLGKGHFAWLEPPFEPRVALPLAAQATASPAELMAWERAAVDNSVAWLARHYAEAGIELARPLRAAA